MEKFNILYEIFGKLYFCPLCGEGVTEYKNVPLRILLIKNYNKRYVFNRKRKKRKIKRMVFSKKVLEKGSKQ